MFCDEVLDQVEPIAAGDVTPEGRVAAHLDTCPNCAAALKTAKRLEQLLRARPVPRASSQFTSRMMSVVRRQRWRSEQFLDVGFNIALGMIAFAVVGVVWFFVYRSGLTGGGNEAVGTLSAGALALVHRVAPS